MRILLTGADSLTGSHILALLLSENNLSIRGIVGSREKAYAIQQQHHRATLSKWDLVVIPDKDLTVAGIFDNILNDDTDPYYTVVHALTPTPTEEVDCLARFINLKSETIIQFLRSIQRLAKQVKRVVVVTSLTPFARWLADPQLERGSRGAIREIPSSTAVDPEYVLAASQAGDNIVYDAVSKWVKTSGAHFDVVYITAPSCYGPTVLPLETSSDLLEANRRIWNICSNEHFERVEAPPYGITHFSDVRDLALASVRAIFTQRVGNQRLLISAGIMPSGSEIVTFLVASFPELHGRVGMGGSSPYEQRSDHSTPQPLDISLSVAILGPLKYRLVEETLADTARQILDLQQRKEWRRIIQS